MNFLSVFSKAKTPQISIAAKRSAVVKIFGVVKQTIDPGESIASKARFSKVNINGLNDFQVEKIYSNLQTIFKK